MSKKQQRVSYLVGIHNALSTAECSVSDMDEGIFCFQQDKIKQVLKTLEELLSMDGITDGNK